MFSALVYVFVFITMEDLFHWIGAPGKTLAINAFDPPSPKRIRFFVSRSFVVTMESFLIGSSALKNNSQSFLNRSSSSIDALCTSSFHGMPLPVTHIKPLVNASSIGPCIPGTLVFFITLLGATMLQMSLSFFSRIIFMEPSTDSGVAEIFCPSIVIAIDFPDNVVLLLSLGKLIATFVMFSLCS